MNAITGMAELLLRGELSDDARGYAQDIKQATANLLSIINDLLDFSKIEAGKLELVSSKYLLSSLINDVISIIRIRIMEKPIRFFTNIDSNIPNALIGDEVRIRQVLLNVLSNAVKYTNKGQISFTITQVNMEDDKVWLKIVVADTGHGIKPEDQAKLFGDFAQVDMKKNRGIEGTGLGLAITKRLCLAMGGDIVVDSEYGKGSAFTVFVPQGFDTKLPYAAVEDAANKKVLIYERRSVYTQSLIWSLENLKVPYTSVSDENAFAEALLQNEWFRVFSSYGLYEKIKVLMDRPDTDFPNNKKPQLALMVDWGTETYIPNVHFMTLPVHSLNIANILNDKADNNGYYKVSDEFRQPRFSFLGVRLLVVDDLSTNLKVAEGLLAPYKATVDTCLSGAEAIELIKSRDYDMVFMDHMMPEMDGIEATAIIRAWEMQQEDRGISRKELPIVALTANAVLGMKEMFIEKGFSDFLAKPIDILKLDEILSLWIPKEKREQKTQGNEVLINNQEQGPFAIPGVDTAKGISRTGGKIDFYRKVLIMFQKDATERMALLKTAHTQLCAGSSELTVITNQAHALKSVAASIGAVEISEQAARIEIAGNAGNTDLVKELLDSFLVLLAKLIDDITITLELNSNK